MSHDEEMKALAEEVLRLEAADARNLREEAVRNIKAAKDQYNDACNVLRTCKCDAIEYAAVKASLANVLATLALAKFAAADAGLATRLLQS